VLGTNPDEEIGTSRLITQHNIEVHIFHIHFFKYAQYKKMSEALGWRETGHLPSLDFYKIKIENEKQIYRVLVKQITGIFNY
jgi:hypothetical protein